MPLRRRAAACRPRGRAHRCRECAECCCAPARRGRPSARCARHRRGAGRAAVLAAVARVSFDGNPACSRHRRRWWSHRPGRRAALRRRSARSQRQGARVAASPHPAAAPGAARGWPGRPGGAAWRARPDCRRSGVMPQRAQRGDALGVEVSASRRTRPEQQLARTRRPTSPQPTISTRGRRKRAGKAPAGVAA